ncbi:hypothetical protein HPB50_006993 [Hyalomma asiaticum]|uniref:Uncharacterized protein n=1 Tax=Hyalomma asiaticum TaxID=266040 RepID=A0ACB7SSD4_HYAAI|nr:hypothetical protein HPB50_006993 [Hyalomma asiaticum]
MASGYLVRSGVKCSCGLNVGLGSCVSREQLDGPLAPKLDAAEYQHEVAATSALDARTAQVAARLQQDAHRRQKGYQTDQYQPGPLRSKLPWRAAAAFLRLCTRSHAVL